LIEKANMIYLAANNSLNTINDLENQNKLLKVYIISNLLNYFISI